MSLDIKEIQDKVVWEKFFSESKYCSILQSWEWGEFESEGLGKNIVRYGVYDNGKLLAISQGIVEVSRFGNYLYFPRGPVANWDVKDQVEVIINALLKHVKGQYISIRIDPDIQDNEENLDFIKKLGFKKAANFRQVQRYWIQNLKGETEEELFANAKEQGMSKSLPRHIRKAAKNGVSVRVSEDIKDIKILTDTLDDLAERKGIPSRPASYYEEQFKQLATSGYMKIFVAEHEGKPISSLLVSFCGDEAATLHGATISDVDPKLYATKRIYWDAILYANEHGFKRFNFYGVVGDKNMDNPKHPSYGYSVFKRRFGGHIEENVGAWDYINNPIMYRALWIQEKYRQMRYQID